jgi:predicted nucleic acid-binding protein
VFSVKSVPRLYNGKFLESRQVLSEAERVQLKKSSFQRVIIENLVEFWRWQSKVIVKKWQERN